MKIKKGLGLVSRPHFSQNFLINDKKFYFVILDKLAKISLSDCVYFSSYSVKYVLFHAWAFDGIMTFEYLKSKNSIISKERKELLR